MTSRVGIGFDAHPLTKGRPLILGGVEVPFNRGLDGHSDGDVLVHAIMDALLGAAGLGDNGTHFPSSDPCLKNASSLGLLSAVAELLYHGTPQPSDAPTARWRIENVDATMLAQKPTLSPFISAMREKIAAAVSVPVSRVSVKATTTDHLGFVGKEEGMAAYAVALLESTA